MLVGSSFLRKHWFLHSKDLSFGGSSKPNRALFEFRWQNAVTITIYKPLNERETLFVRISSMQTRELETPDLCSNRAITPCFSPASSPVKTFHLQQTQATVHNFWSAVTCAQVSCIPRRFQPMKIKRQCDLILITPKSGLMSPNSTPSFCYPAHICIAHLWLTPIPWHLHGLYSLYRLQESWLWWR